MIDADPRDLKARQRAKSLRADLDAQARLKLANLVDWLVSGQKGRELVWLIFEQCGVFRSAWDANNSVQSRNEGMKLFGTWMLELIVEHAPAMLSTILQEGRLRAEADNNASSS